MTDVLFAAVQRRRRRSTSLSLHALLTRADQVIE